MSNTEETKVTDYALHFTLDRLPSCVVWDDTTEGFKITIDGEELKVISSEKRNYGSFSNGSAVVDKTVFDKVCDTIEDHYTFRSLSTLCAFVKF